MKTPILPLLVTLAMACVTTLFAQEPPKPTKPTTHPAGSSPTSKVVPPKGQGGGTLIFNKATLETVLSVYSDLTGRTIILPSADLPPIVIDLKPAGPISEDEAAAMIADLIAAHKMSLVHPGEKTAKVIPDTEAQKAAVPFTSIDNLPNSDLYVAVKIKTLHVLPSELINVLKPFAKLDRDAVIAVDASRTLILRDCARNVKCMLEILKEADVPDTLIHLTEVIPLKKGKAAEIATTLCELTDKPRVFFSPPPISTPDLDSNKPRSESLSPELKFVTTGRSSSSSSRPSSSSRGSSSSYRSSSLIPRSPKTPLGNTSIVPLYGSNSILVVAPTKEKMELVKKIVGLIEAGAK